MSEPPPIRYLSREHVLAAMPDLPTRIHLAEHTMRALAEGAQLPPKIGVHPRPEGSFAHAMPAYAPGTDADAGRDLLGIKWVAGFATNNERGWPAINALVVLNDPGNGLPVAILDGGPITAMRTAAVSGVAISRFVPPVGDRTVRAALIGAGTQGHSHVPVLGHVLPGVSLALFDRHDDRAAALAEAARRTDGIGAVRVAASPRDAIEGADVVVTTASFGPVRQVMEPGWLVPDALVVPVDYDMYCSASVAREAALFLVDEVGQFLANRDAGLFAGYPEPGAALGTAILERVPRPQTGRVVVSHLGVGLADVVFADAIVRAATAGNLGRDLPR